MSVPGNINQLQIGAAASAAGAGANITKSVRLNSADSAYLNRTPSSVGNRRTWTWSGWVKRSSVATSDQGIIAATGGGAMIRFKSNQLDFVVNGATHRRTSEVFRDNSGWYHFVWAVDTTQATASDRSRFYVNGVEVTDWGTDNALTLDSLTGMNNTIAHVIGATDTVPNDKQDAYLADFYLIDGSQLEPTSFGAYDDNGVWQAAAYSGTYPDNSFHLFDFANESTVGHDSSGNNNDWTANNISTSGTDTDILRDVPQNGDSSDDTGAGGELSSNYSTMNPLAKNSNTTISNGNLLVSSTGVYTTLSTIAFPSTGKYYAEFTVNATDGPGYPFVGIGGYNDAGVQAYSNPDTGAFYAQGGYITGSVSVPGLTALSANDIVGVAYDASNGKVWFSLNGTYVLSGDPANGTNETATLSANASGYSFATSTYVSATVTFNAGQRAFNTNAPSGFQCLCTSNLPTPTIADGSGYINAITYTGDGVNDRTITTTLTTVGAAWIKRRDVADNNRIATVVQGGHAWLSTNLTGAENNATTIVRGFSDNTFDIGTDSSVNASSGSYVAWAWDAGTSNASNTDGSISSTVRANIAPGFSIVTYTGTGSNATVGHGLGAAPGFIVIKDRDAATDWMVYHEGLGNTKYINLNLNAGAVTASHWQNTSPTSSVFSIGTSIYLNNSGNDYIAYCWAPVEGYSSFGFYDGNASTDGPFIYTGFRPAWLLIKRSNGSSKWFLVDSTRDPVNTVNLYLQPSSSSEEIDTATEGTQNYIDFLSNGFKLRGTEISTNASQEYIYIAFAENPFQANGGLAR